MENIKLEFKRIKNIIYIKDNNLQLNIVPECSFDTNGINVFGSKSKSIPLFINKNVEGHLKFINIIRNIYDKCSEYIETDYDFNPDVIINPLNKINDTTYVLNLYITDFNGNITASFYDSSNTLISLEELKDKTFSIYPAINIDKISLNKDKEKAYLNMHLKEGFVDNIKNKRLLDFNKYKSYVNNKNKNVNQ